MTEMPIGESTSVQHTAAAWQTNSAALAAWTQRWLVNRTDAYGAYLPLHLRIERQKNYTAKLLLTADTLQRHFAGRDVGDLIGLHAIALDNMCRWVGADLDQHGEFDAAVAERNFVAAIGLFELATKLGYAPLLSDSNGRGGYHLLIIFDQPITSDLAFGFGIWLADRAVEFGLADRPESFPKQPRLTDKVRFGNWLRLPGRHHTHDHWSRVWTGTGWAIGEQAIAVILATAGRSAINLPTASPAPPTPAPRSAILIPDGDDDRNPVRRVLRLLKDVYETADGWVACCPAHRDRSPSLSIRVGDRGTVLLYCHAGCEIKKIVAALGFTMEDLFAKLPYGRREKSLLTPATAQTLAIVGATTGSTPATSGTADTINSDMAGSKNSGIDTTTFDIWTGVALPNELRVNDGDWDGLMRQFEAALRPEHLAALAASLGLSVHCMHEYRLGVITSAAYGPCWAIGEVDAGGRIIGIQRRYVDGSKCVMRGGHRGLIIPRDWRRRPPPLYCVEGFSDSAALSLQGYPAIGRPSAKGGVKLLAELLADYQYPIIIAGENDLEADGSWPGRDGAKYVAAELTRLLNREVTWILPPAGFKDAREFVVSRSFCHQ